nr:hypothetical protein [Tanacetum cinerariifolium]
VTPSEIKNPKKSKVLQAHSGALQIQSWFLNTALENTKERKTSGTVNWGAPTVVRVFAHMQFEGMKEASTSVAYQAELGSLALKLEEENETLVKAKWKYCWLASYGSKWDIAIRWKRNINMFISGNNFPLVKSFCGLYRAFVRYNQW